MPILLEQISRLGFEVSASVVDPHVWFAIVAALIIGSACLAFGTWAARRVGLLEVRAPLGETLGVGLASGLIVLTSVWALIASSGRSSFTTVAVMFVAAVAVGASRPTRASRNDRRQADVSTTATHVATGALHPAKGALAMGGFVVAVGLLFGATLTPSPRDGLQPVEFQDTAFYATLSRELATSGTESIYAPSGFDQIPGLPTQTWYHWGELWLSAASISTFGLEPTFARSYVALPLSLLAAAALTGTLVRRVSGARSRWAFILGASVCLFLAPVPLFGTFFSSWPAGLVFGITMYGLAPAAILLLTWVLVVGRTRRRSTAMSLFSAAAVASLVPIHIVAAILGLVGWAAGASPWLARTTIRRRWRLELQMIDLARAIATVVAVLATIGWGIWTGHGIGASAHSARVLPFNEAWRVSVALSIVGAGLFLMIPVGLAARPSSSLIRPLVIGTTALIGTGALVWGLRVADFISFYFYYAGLALFATPVAAIVVRAVWDQANVGRIHLIRIGLFVTCAIQLGFGIVVGILRLEQGRDVYEPWSTDFIADVRNLPANARIAYACNDLDEIEFWNAQLISLDAHTGRHVVPMCFQPDLLSVLSGAELSLEAPSPLFELAPQRRIYPTRAAEPTPAAVVAFLKEYGIEFVLADRAHPNTLVPGAIRVTSGGGAELLRIP